MKPVAMSLLIASLFGFVFSETNSQSPQGASPSFRLVPRADIGFLGVMSHLYRVGKESSGNTTFNFVTQGGQDILFPYLRLSIDAIAFQRHHFTFLYQPLTLTTRTVAGRNSTGSVQIDGVNFGSSPVNITYGFDFYRLSYFFDFIGNGKTELAAGLSFQLRNANIVFESANGELRAVQNNVGLVPIIKLRAAHWMTPKWGLEFEGDGFYAAGAGFNGASRPFEGWIWDAGLSLKAKVFDRTTSFLTFRSIGGGANGTDAYDNVSATKNTQKETYNSLATFSITLGFSLDLF